MINNKKLQWKARYNNKFSNEYDFLETILVANGIEENEVNHFLHPTSKDICNPLLMNNMAQAIEKIHFHIINNSKILLRVDPDCDGFFSSGILYQFLKQLNPNLQIDYILNYNKQHGLTYEDVSNFTRTEYNLIIIPDASMTVSNAKMITTNFDTEIVVLDHHLISNEYYDIFTQKYISKEEAESIQQTEPGRIQVDCYTNYCLAVNCTDGNYPNPNLSGAGVVQKFIEGYIDTYQSVEEIDSNLKTYYLDMVSLAISADDMSLKSFENRYYVLSGLKENNWHNDLINELVNKKSEDMKYGRYIKSMLWNIAPLINGCTRYGKVEEQLDLFRAIIGEQEIRYFQPKRKHKEDPKPPLEEHTLQWDVARNLVTIKGRQDKEVLGFVKELQDKIEKGHLDKNSVIFVDGSNILTKNTVTGLVANKLTNQYFRPIVLMREYNAETYGGSMRGYNESNIENTKQFLEQAGITVEGHSEAAGIKFPKNKLETIIAKCNQMMPPDQLLTLHTVDWEIPAIDLKKEYVQEVANEYAIWGNDIPEPSFAITNLQINASQIEAYGEGARFIRFNYNGINFVKNYCKRNDYEDMTQRGRNKFGPNNNLLNLNIIGSFVLNKFEDKIYPEVKILYFDSKVISKQESSKASPIKTEYDDLDFDW